MTPGNPAVPLAFLSPTEMVEMTVPMGSVIQKFSVLETTTCWMRWMPSENPTELTLSYIATDGGA